MARLLTLLLIMVATVLTGAAEDKTHRVPRMASGDITSGRAVIWGQMDTSGEMEVEYSLDSHFIDSTRVQGPVMDETSDFSGRLNCRTSRRLPDISIGSCSGNVPDNREMCP